MSIDQQINSAVQPVADSVFNFIFTAMPLPGGHEMPLVLLLLVSVGLFFTFYLGFANIRHFGDAFDILRGKHDTGHPDGQINRFQALMTTMSGTVGLGNIAGVAVAISIGGPGAVIWMLVTGLLGMTTKMVEATLGVKFRRTFPDGHVSGGPMYYLRDGLKQKGLGKVGLFLAGFVSVCCVFAAIGAGNLFQGNQSYAQLVNVTGGEASFFADKGWLVGLVLASLVAFTIIGGIKSIAQVTSRIVPFMGGLYLIAGLVVIAFNYQNIPTALVQIFTYAFSLEAGLGGLIGALIQGVQRGAFSNEMGFGTGAIPHSAAQTDEPASQGLVAMIGPFIDTIVICMVTALVIVISGVYQTHSDLAGVEMTSQAFGDTLSWFPYVLAVTVFLFAFSTMISWSYYGMKAIDFLFSENKTAEMSFKIFYCLITIVGTSASLDYIIKLADAVIFAMAIPNIIGLYIMADIVKAELKSFKERKLNK